MKLPTDLGMTDDSSPPPNALDPTDEWADPESVSGPAFRRSFSGEARVPIQPRVVVSPRLREIEKAAAENEGLRIAPRILPVPTDPSEATEARQKIQIQEHGKEVVRLEAEIAAPYVERYDPLPKMQPRGPKRAKGEAKISSEWGKAAKHSYKWLGWAAGAVAVAMLIGLLVQPLLEERDGKSKADPFSSLRVVEDVVNAEDPMVFFDENPVEVVGQIHQAMATYARARTLEEALPVIRHGEKLKPTLSKTWKPWGVPSDWEISDSDAIGYDSVGRVPYAVIAGVRPDFSRYQVFMVREGGRMLVDWEASEGRGTHSLQDLSDPSLKSAEVRVDASPVAYYTMAYPEDYYRAFRLVLSESESFIWGYVLRGSPADHAMEEIFMENRQFSDKPTSGKVRLRLKRGEGSAMANQWLILDVLHKGWVTP